MRLHERTSVVRNAQLQIAEAISAAEVVHHLTFAEIFSILSSILASYAKYAIRAERHPDSGKGGDEA